MLEGKKTYIAAVILLAYQVYTGDFSSAASSIHALAGPLLMLLLRKITKTPPAL